MPFQFKCIGTMRQALFTNICNIYGDMRLALLFAILLIYTEIKCNIIKHE